MAEHCLWTTGEDRRHPSTLDGQCSVADRIDPLVQTMQATSRQAPLNRPSSDAQESKLPAGDDTMLALGKVGQQSIDFHRLPTLCGRAILTRDAFAVA